MKTKLSVSTTGRHHACGSRTAGFWARSALAVSLAGLLTLDAGGVGFRLPNQDPEAIARGNAFVATADNPSAIYYNPAGITQLPGQNFDLGIYAVSSNVRYETKSDQTFKTDSTLQPVPQVYYVSKLPNLPISAGVGVYVPYGLSVDWGNNTPFRTIAEKGKLSYICFNPVIAWQICSGLSIAAGPTINYSKATFQRGITPSFLSTSDEFRFVGSTVAPGFNAGLLWQPLDQWSFGFSYRHQTDLNYTGHAEVTSPFLPPQLNGATSSSAEIRFPYYVVGGVSFRPTENWNIEFNIDWTDWHSDQTVVFRGTPVGDQTYLLNYRSSFMYEFGVTRKLPDNYWVALGYFFSENSSPDANYSMLIPDSDLHLGSIGFGHKGRHWDWAAAYHFGYNPGRTVSGSQSSATPNPFGETADGKYRAFNSGISASVTVKF